jgi:hypothetical protein
MICYQRLRVLFIVYGRVVITMFNKMQKKNSIMKLLFTLILNPQVQ